MIPTDPPFGAQFDAVTLDMLRVKTRSAVGASVAQTLKLEWLRDELADNLVCELTAWLLVETLPAERIEREATTVFLAPATWWQAWKVEHPRLWRGPLARRWPPRMAEHRRVATFAVDIRRYWSYPQASIQMPEMGRPVRILQPGTDVRWRP